MKKLHSFTLIEILLVILVAAVIILVSVRRYSIYRHKLYVTQIRHDVTIIFQALNEYYQAQGCKEGGIFKGKINKDLIKSNKLQLTWDKRLPLVTQYQAMVIDTDKQTASKKEIYQFEVKATLANNYPPAQYQGVLNAGSIDGQTLIWKNLPNQNVVDAPSSLWIMNQEANLFKESVAEDTDTSCAF